MSNRVTFVFGSSNWKSCDDVCDVMCNVTCVAPFGTYIFHDASLLKKKKKLQSINSTGDFKCHTWTSACQRYNITKLRRRVSVWKELTCWLLIRFVVQSQEFRYFDFFSTFFILPSLNWSLIGKINCWPPALPDRKSSGQWLWNTVQWKVADRFS